MSRLRKIDGSGIFFSCSRRSMSINSVFKGSGRGDLSSSSLTTCRRRSRDSEMLFLENEMNNLVSSSYK